MKSEGQRGSRDLTFPAFSVFLPAAVSTCACAFKRFLLDGL